MENMPGGFTPAAHGYNEFSNSSAPINDHQDDTTQELADPMQISADKEIMETEFITVTHKKKRFRTSINAIHVPGSSDYAKLNNLYAALANVDGFLDCTTYRNTAEREIWYTAVFDSKDTAIAATKLQLFDGNEFKLTLLKDRADEEVKDRTLVVRDLPLDLNKQLLKSILEERFGEIETMKTRTAGPWFRADVTFNSKDAISNNLDIWSIQYKKDFCRVAPASFNKEQIDQRNMYTAKLTNLPFGTTAIDLKEILHQVGAKSCFMPRTQSRYTRKRFAYISFESSEQLEKVMTNVRVLYEEIELLWETPDHKTCHKCGSPSHLVVDCEERESSLHYKNNQRKFTGIYSRFKVPNYKKLTGQNKFQIEKKTTGQTTRPITPITTGPPKDDNIKSLLENLFKTFSKDIEQKLEGVNKQLLELNDRIKIIEIKQGLRDNKTSPSTQNKQKSVKFNLGYFPTKDALEQSKVPDNNNNNNENEPEFTSKVDQAQQKLGKRTLPTSEGSSSEENSTTTLKGKGKNRVGIQNKRQNTQGLDNTNYKVNKEDPPNTEIQLIKDSQKVLGQTVEELNTAVINIGNQLGQLLQHFNGNGSSNTTINQ